MGIGNRAAARLAATGWGQRVLAQAVDLSALKIPPGPRVWLGLGLIAVSYLLGLPLMALVGWLTHQRSDGLVLVLGGGAAVVVIHLIFAAGVWLAGANYTGLLIRWTARRFMRRYLDNRPPGRGAGS